MVEFPYSVKTGQRFLINMQYLQGLHGMSLWLAVKTSTASTAFIVFKIKSTSFSILYNKRTLPR